MINLTVKTLDSQNHSFSLEDDITVRGFKEQIAESVGVPADSQRLIYCGRVLQDEKKLIEYDVNGKVIHLVQRVPPQIGQRGNNSGQGQDQGPGQGQGTNRPHYFRHRRGQVHIPRFDGNTMYLGAMSFPADGDGQGPARPPACPRQSVRRLAVAKRMFTQANQTINRLGDPNSQATENSNTNATNQEQAQEQSQEQSQEQLQGAGNDQEQEPSDATFEIGGGVAGTGGLAQAASVAINAALSETGLDDFAAFSAALNSFTFLRRRNEGANPSVIRVHIQRNNGEGGESGNTSSANDTEQQEQSQPAQPDEQQREAQSESQSQPQPHQPEQPQSQQQEQQQQQQQQAQPQPQQQQSQEEAQTPAQNTDAEGPRSGGRSYPASRLQSMVELLNRVLRTHDRLRPYIEHYRNLMSRDPVLSTGGGPNSLEENQRIIDGVSETLHFLSHAYHALSDIIVDLNQPPPRNLTARPFITQHSALLQAGIPIQVEAHISLHGRNQNNNNDNESPTAPSAAEGSNAAESGEFDGPPNENTDGSAPQQESESANQQSQAFGTVFNVPHNVEVLMEMSPEMGGAEQGQQNFNNRNNNNNGNPGGISAGIFPWGATPPPDFMRNLMQAVAGHMTFAVPTSTTGNPPASTSGEQTATTNEGTATVTAPNVEGANTNPSQSTQARGNTGTHPTTSTQTRSTPRPHVFHSNVHPLNMGLPPARIFDAFLPCKSHHVRPNPITILNSSPNTASAQQNQANQNSATTEPTQTATSIPTADSAPSSETAQGNQTPTMPSSSQNIPFVQLLTQLLSGAGAQAGQVTAGPAGFMQMFSNAEGIPVIQGMMSNGSGQSGGINLIDLLTQVSGANASANNGSGGQARTNQTSQGDDLVFDLIVAVGTVLQNMTTSEWEALRLGIWEPLAGIRNILREFFQNFFGSTSLSGSEERVANRLISALHPIIEQVLANEASERDNSERSIDLPATIEGLIKRHFINILRLLFDEDADEARFVQGMLASMWSLQMESSSVIQYSFREQPIHVDTLASRIATRLTDGVEPSIRQWIITNLRPHITSFFQNTIPLLDREVTPLLVYKDIPSATTSTPIVERSTPVQQAQPIPEPMETGAIEEVRELESLDTEEMEPFAGQDAVPSDWVPIISRDRVRQRRQLQSQMQMQGMTGSGVGGFSDAYLGGMPSKRRKLIEQQKPRILLSPTMERLVRDSTGRAGIEEVEGAAAAVATDAGVRRAFGQAIRGCLYQNPRRQTAPDFPDPLRFPNATKYFANSDETSKK